MTGPVSNFVKKPVVVSAIQWTGENLKEVMAFTGAHPRFHEWFSSWDEYVKCVNDSGGIFKIFTLEGTMKASPGDWIIRGVKGEFYPCKPDIFESTYARTQSNSGCLCTFAQKMQGDGCRYCNPQEYIDRLHDQISERDQEESSMRKIAEFQLDQNGHPRLVLATGYDYDGNQWKPGTIILAGETEALIKEPS